MKNAILYTLFCLIGVLTVKAQNDFELTIDGPTVVAGEDLIINYTYSSTEDGRITFSIDLYNDWAVIDDDVAWGEVNVTAGSNETRTVAIPIGADITPSSDLTGSHLYRIDANLYSNGQWRVWAGGTVTVNEASHKLKRLLLLTLASLLIMKLLKPEALWL